MFIGFFHSKVVTTKSALYKFRSLWFNLLPDFQKTIFLSSGFFFCMCVEIFTRSHGKNMAPMNSQATTFYQFVEVRFNILRRTIIGSAFCFFRELSWFMQALHYSFMREYIWLSLSNLGLYRSLDLKVCTTYERVVFLSPDINYILKRRQLLKWLEQKWT